MDKETKAFAIRIGLFVAAIVGGYFLLVLAFEYAGPFVVAFVAALLMDPLVNVMVEKLKIPRAVSSLIALILILAVVGLILSLGITAIVSEISNLINGLPSYYSDIQVWFTDGMDGIRQWYGELSPEIINIINQALNQLYQWLKQILQLAMNWIIQMFNVVPGATLFIVFAVLATYIISKDKRIIGRTLSYAIPEKWREQTYRLQSDVLGSAWRLLWTQALLVLISTAITITGFFILNVNYAVILGIISGLLDILPIVGPATLFIPWIIYCFFAGDMWLGIGLTILYAVMSISRQVLQARLVSDNVGLHPLVSLIALYVGMQIFGFIGVIIGPLIALIIVQAIKNGLFSFGET
jgi:sporulation integral membrane protein YtvI